MPTQVVSTTAAIVSGVLPAPAAADIPLQAKDESTRSEALPDAPELQARIPLCHCQLHLFTNSSRYWPVVSVIEAQGFSHRSQLHMVGIQPALCFAQAFAEDGISRSTSTVSLATLDDTPQLSEQGDWSANTCEEAINGAVSPAADGPAGEHAASSCS